MGFEPNLIYLCTRLTTCETLFSRRGWKPVRLPGLLPVAVASVACCLLLLLLLLLLPAL